MKNFTAADLLARIDAHISAGMIWNVDHEELKQAITRYIDKARDEAQAVYLGVSDRHDNRDQVALDLYYAHAYPATFKSMVKKVDSATKKGVCPSMQGVLEAYQNYVRDCAPICERFNTLKPLIKKGRKPSTDPTKTPVRTIDHTGTCPCCFRNIKLIDGKMVRHGYQVQYSQFVGDCYGVGYKPYEVSVEGTQAYLDVLKKNLIRAQAELTAIPHRTSFIVQERISWTGTTKSVEIKIGDAGFLRQMELAVLEKGNEVSGYMSDIRLYTNYVTKWEAKPLPDGDKSHMEG